MWCAVNKTAHSNTAEMRREKQKEPLHQCVFVSLHKVKTLTIKVDICFFAHGNLKVKQNAVNDTIIDCKGNLGILR